MNAVITSDVILANISVRLSPTVEIRNNVYKIKVSPNCFI